MSDDFDVAEIKNSISRNVIITLLTRIFFLSTRLFVPPITLAFLSLEEYGIWSCCFIIIGYVGMSVFGVSNVYIRYVAVYHARGEIENINRLISTGVIFVGILSVIFLSLLGWMLPWIISLFHISSSLYTTAYYIFFGTIAIFLFDLTIDVFANILQSLRHIVAERIATVIGFSIETVCIILFLVLGWGIYGLFYAFVIRTLVCIILYAILCYRYLPQLKIRPKYFDLKALKLLYHFGGIVQLSGIFGTINRGLEKLIGGIFVGIQATGLYEVGEKFPAIANDFSGSINGVIFPTTAYLHAKEQKNIIVKLYLNGSRYINIMTGLMMGFMGPFAFPLIASWLGTDEKFYPAALILAIFTLPFQMDVVTGPASAIYRSINMPEKELFYGSLRLLSGCLVTILGFSLFGYHLMVINVSIASMIILTAFAYLIYSNKQFEISQLLYLKKVLLPGLFPYVIGYALMGLMHFLFAKAHNDRLHTFALLCTALLGYVIVVMLILYYFILEWGEKKYFKHQLSHTYKELMKKKN